LLYALNSNSNSIAGFRFSERGDISPIPGSVRPVTSESAPPLTPRQIGFDRTGRVLVVSLLGPPPGAIDTFVMDRQDRPGPATAHPATTPLPFGFDFDQHNHLVMSQVTDLAATGNTATYNLDTRTGALTPIDTKTSGGAAPCWVVITNDGHYAFVVNAGGGPPPTVARYQLFNSGTLELLGETPPNGPEFARTDAALSRDSRYFYVTNPGLFGPSKIDEYRVEKNGDLVLIGNTTPDGAPGQSGLAVR
jgi:6-phosphogluconolactonase (cycloisomerase 2 family)